MFSDANPEKNGNSQVPIGNEITALKEASQTETLIKYSKL
jgi:hypothetical protein